MQFELYGIFGRSYDHTYIKKSRSDNKKKSKSSIALIKIPRFGNKIMNKIASVQEKIMDLSLMLVTCSDKKTSLHLYTASFVAHPVAVLISFSFENNL